jgi:ATP synthase I subunit
MTGRELTTSVTHLTAIAVPLMSLAGGGVAGVPGAVGVLTGGALALVGFRILAARLRAVGGPAAAGHWIVLAAVRFAVVGGVAALLFVAGWAHPVGWLVGYSVLPAALVVQGLRSAREENGSWT